MNRVKIFSSSDGFHEYATRNIQNDIDKWQTNNPLFTIINVSTSTSNARIVTTILYDDGTLPPMVQIK